MIRADRHLHFDVIDMQTEHVMSQYSLGQKKFTAQPKPGERVDDLLLRIRDEFNIHQCHTGKFRE